MPVFVVHDDPLPVAQLRQLNAEALQFGIEVADEARQHRLAGPGPHQLRQRARPVDGRNDRAGRMAMRPAEIVRDGVLFGDGHPALFGSVGIALRIDRISHLTEQARGEIAFLRFEGADADIAFADS